MYNSCDSEQKSHDIVRDNIVLFFRFQVLSCFASLTVKCHIYRDLKKAGEVAKGLKAPAVLSRDPGSIPSTSMVAQNCL